jgi:hypothetical protein
MIAYAGSIRDLNIVVYVLNTSSLVQLVGPSDFVSSLHGSRVPLCQSIGAKSPILGGVSHTFENHIRPMSPTLSLSDATTVYRYSLFSSGLGL